ncbi:phage shock envelope stress response protein PspM, partial [Rhodococcus gordoniae]|uniref:phage shock envelope stress response protein PspM n=1 Tax=Rhodococcus gordoniae TaxID=223392 RepID=UPI003CC91083
RPHPPPRRRPLPPADSVARAPMERLAANEESLRRLLGVLVRSNSVASDDLAEIDDAARAAASALDAVVEDVVALESAARGSAAAKTHLSAAITDAGERLGTGVDQFEELVAAAARLAATAEGNRSLAMLDRRRAELIATSDKLESWAQSWREVGQIEQRYR